MARIKKFSPNIDPHLTSYNVFIVDTDPNSEYFKITEFKESFTGGKNGFLIEGSEHLMETTEIKIEILDVDGKPIYYEPGDGIPEYYEGLSKLIAVYVYEDTPIGTAKITILGELKTYNNNSVTQNIPDAWKGVYNLKWEKSFKVNRLLSNEDKVRFYRRPKVTIDEIVSPLYSTVVNTITQQGKVDGIPLTPIEGQSLTNYKMATFYQLNVQSGSNWTGSIVGSTLSFPDINYYPIVDEVINSTQLLVSTPYTQNSIVKSFVSQSYTASFNELSVTGSGAVSLTGSFAKINISDLTTFVGDAARVKVFRKSQSDPGDYQFTQEVVLESNELLVDLNSPNTAQEYYGIFTPTNISNYWRSSSINLSVAFDQDYLFDSAKLDGISTPTYFYESSSISITEGAEYSLDFNVRLTSPVTSTNYIKAFLSGSRQVTVNNVTSTVQVNQPITTIYASSLLLQKTTSSDNIKAEQIDNARLYFEIVGSGWYIANVSLKAAQETAFSPDEITFIQSVPRSLPVETFNYRFEFYDINSNYVPVRVETSKTFNGGNLQAQQTVRSLKLVPTTLYFQFDSGSNPLPPTSIAINVQKTGLTGSVSFTSQSIDIDGNEITASYLGGQYPGLLLDITSSAPYLTVGNFTGSRSDINVQYIQYTGQCEDLSDTTIISKVLSGASGAGTTLFYVTSDKNVFTFDPDDNYKPLPVDDYIDMRLVNQNMPSSSVGLLITSGSVGGIAPSLSFVATIGDADVYRLFITSSTHQSGSDGYYFGLGKSHYDFTYSSSMAPYTSSIIIDAVEKGSKGKGLFASADRNQFYYKMTDVTAYPAGQTATILVKRQNLGSLVNTITVTKVGSGPDLTVGATSGGVTIYTIDTSAYSYSHGTTTYTFTAYDLNGDAYVDSFTLTALIGESQLSVTLSNDNTSFKSDSVGFVSGSEYDRGDGVVSVSVGADGISFNNSPTNNTFRIQSVAGTDCTPNSVSPTTNSYGISAMSADSATLSVVVRYQDGRGVTNDITKIVNYSKAKSATPVVTIAANPQSQTVQKSLSTYGVPTAVSVSTNEGGASYAYAASGLQTFQVTGVTNATNNNDGTVTPNTPSTDAGVSGVVTVSYINSENTTVSGKSVNFNVAVALQGTGGTAGQDGNDGTSGSSGRSGTNGSGGSSGTQGSTGPGIVFTGPWSAGATYQFDITNGRRDAVYEPSSGHYYATMQTVPAGTALSNTAYWLDLGTGDLFVAAKIAIFEESYIRNTLNIGTTGTTYYSANITIAGGTTSPYISMGQNGTQGYGNNGVFIGGGATPQLSLKSATNSLLWDGTNLTVSGSGTFTGLVQAGNVSIGKDAGGVGANGIYLNAYNYWYESGGVYLINVGDASTGLHYQSNIGVLNFNGDITSAATITGGVFRTAASGQRVVLDGAANTLQFYNSSNNQILYVGTASTYHGLFMSGSNSIISGVGSYWINSDGAGTRSFLVTDGAFFYLSNTSDNITMTPFYIQVDDGVTYQSKIYSYKIESPAFYQTSDRNFKRDITLIKNDKLLKFDAIQFKQFIFKGDITDRIRYGVIAQDIEADFPELVIESVSNDKNNNEQKYLTVDYNSIFALKICALEEKIKQLERR